MEKIKSVKLFDDKDKIESIWKEILSVGVFEKCLGCINHGDRKVAKFYIKNFQILTDAIHFQFPQFKLMHIMRAYIHNLGYISKHRDVSAFNIADTTLLLFINDDFEGGILYFETPSGMLSIKPRSGYAVAFPKNILHWTDELYSEKKIIIIDMQSPNPYYSSSSPSSSS